MDTLFCFVFRKAFVLRHFKRFCMYECMNLCMYVPPPPPPMYVYPAGCEKGFRRSCLRDDRGVPGVRFEQKSIRLVFRVLPFKAPSLRAVLLRFHMPLNIKKEEMQRLHEYLS